MLWPVEAFIYSRHRLGMVIQALFFSWQRAVLSGNKAEAGQHCLNKR